MMNLVALFTGMVMLMTAPANVGEVTEHYVSIGDTNTKYVYVDDELVGEYEYDFETEEWIEVID